MSPEVAFPHFLRRAFVRHLACVWLLGIATFWLWMNRYTFSGDPEIHLVFARNLLDGYPLQFNKGIWSSGETSPAYMALLASEMWLFGEANTAILMKLQGIASALGLLSIIFLECRRCGLTAVSSTIVTASIAAAPWFFFQASLGMENMPFALMVALCVRSSLSPQERRAHRLMVVVVAHTLFFWRPEALLLVAYLYSRWVFKKQARLWELSVALVSSFSVLLVVRWIERETGVPMQGAGMLRALVSRLDANRLGSTNFFISLKPLAFLTYTWPMIVIACVARRNLCRDRLLLLVFLVAIPMLLHIGCVFPNTHFSRYSLYFWPGLFFASLPVVANPELGGDFGRFVQRWGVQVVVLNLAVVGLVEGLVRIRTGQGWNYHLLASLRDCAPAAVKSRSDALCRVVGCSGQQVGVAAYEVQLRRRLDERFVVRSLDGVVDHDLAAYVSAAGINHLGYLDAKDIRVIAGFGGMSGDPNNDSLRKIRDEARTLGVAVLGCSRFEFVRIEDWFPRGVLVRTLSPQCSPDVLKHWL